MEDKTYFESMTKELEEAQNRFWDEEYPNKTFEEKVSYWSGSIHRIIRWTNESVTSGTCTFDKNWYLSCKEQDPNFDELLPYILDKLNYDRETFYKTLED